MQWLLVVVLLNRTTLIHKSGTFRVRPLLCNHSHIEAATFSDSSSTPDSFWKAIRHAFGQSGYSSEFSVEKEAHLQSVDGVPAHAQSSQETRVGRNNGNQI